MKEYLDKYRNLNLPGQLIVINVAVWCITQLLRLVTWVCTGHDCPWTDWLALHADLTEFLLTPWTLLTYFFVHADLGDNMFHLVFNMFWLWWFGQYFLRYHTSRQLLGLYLTGGLAAGCIFLLAYQCIPALQGWEHTRVLGASGAIFALVAAVAVRQPDEPIYLNLFVRIVPVRMKWFALVALGINLMNLTSGANVGGIICHLGGMAYGLLYGYAERQGTDITRPFNRFCDWLVDLFRPRPRMKATRGGASHIPNDRRKDHDYNQRQREHQQKVDAILDKISRSGYDGLTAEEKAMLFDASQRRKS